MIFLSRKRRVRIGRKSIRLIGRMRRELGKIDEEEGKRKSRLFGGGREDSLSLSLFLSLSLSLPLSPSLSLSHTTAVLILHYSLLDLF